MFSHKDFDLLIGMLQCRKTKGKVKQCYLNKLKSLCLIKATIQLVWGN